MGEKLQKVGQPDPIGEGGQSGVGLTRGRDCGLMGW